MWKHRDEKDFHKDRLKTNLTCCWQDWLWQRETRKRNGRRGTFILPLVFRLDNVPVLQVGGVVFIWRGHIGLLVSITLCLRCKGVMTDTGTE